jgi:DNA-binding IclR family transcriptional regulator
MSILLTAGSVLRCFGTDRTELTVTEVAALTGMAKSTASRVLRTMRESGLLDAVGTSKRFRPGVLLIEVGLLYRLGSTLLAAADRAVAELVEEFGHTGYLSVREGREVLGITYHQGRTLIRVGTPIGRRLPADGSATGRALLARLDDTSVRALYAPGFTPASPNSPQTLEALLESLQHVRHTGLARSHDEASAGIEGLAVAVGNPLTGEDMALCVVYPLSAASPQMRADITAALVRQARHVAMAFGDHNCTALAA